MSDTNFILPTYPPGRNTGPMALRSGAGGRGGGGGGVMSGGGGSAPATITLTPATGCGNGPAYTAAVDIVDADCGPCLRLRWIPVAGSGARTITFSRVGCDEDSDAGKYVEFATDDPLLCTADGESCGDNKLVVRVTCACCDSPGPGWYCVDGVCQYVTECVDGVWAGPFDSEEECSCEVEVVCCDGISYPAVICVSFSDDTIGFFGGMSLQLRYYGADSTIPDWLEELGPNPDLWAAQMFAYTVVCVGMDEPAPVRVLARPCVSDEDKWVISISSPGETDDWAFVSGISAVPSCELPIEIECDYDPEQHPPFTGTCWNGHVGTIKATLSADLDGCETILPTWNCVPGSGCVEVYDGSGQYASEVDCIADCGGIITYDCVDGVCVPVAGAGGEYATEAACEAACAGDDDCCALLPGDPVFLTVNGGPSDGEYESVWVISGPGGNPGAFFDLGAAGIHGVWCVNIESPNDDWQLDGSIPYDSVDCGPPVSVVFTDGFGGGTVPTISGATSAVFHT